MKKLLLPLLMAFVLTGCSTYQYSSRSVGVDNRNVGAKETAAELIVDYNRSVTATSDYQMSKQEAIKEAEYLCITQNNIDVLVDPIFKIEYTPLELKKKYRATVTGYAGTYVITAAGVDAVKDYKIEEIEKYKLLTDPDFSKYYYNKGTGDSYYINSSASQMTKAGASLAGVSLAVAPKLKAKTPKTFDYGKSLKLRNTGRALTIVGAFSAIVLGASIGDGEGRVGFMSLGSVCMAAGIPMWVVGSSRLKKSNLSVSSSANGVGLRYRF